MYVVQVKRGQEYLAFSMDSAVMLEPQERQTVEFMIIPGFRVGRTVIKSLVYVAENVVDHESI